ncbi:MAG: glycosyltransferase family 2 protein [Taibaiella sp.]|nr:glycosyltransferase family 2 protein [Taibaiella sp.]
MQSLQKAVLNNIVPGKTPVFIVSPNIHDGDTLAALLSYHLRAADTDGVHNNLVTSNNYFYNASVHRIMTRAAGNDQEYAESDRDTINFVLSKDFGNGTIWGLQLNYEAFLSLELVDRIENGFFIFLFGADIHERKITHSRKELLDRIYKSHLYNSQRSVLVHLNDVNFVPELVLRALPFDLNSYRIYPDAAQKRANFKLFSLESSDEVKLIDGLMSKDSLLAKSGTWFTGPEVLVVLLVRTTTKFESVFAKIGHYFGSFVKSPVIKVITNSVEDEKLLHEHTAHRFAGLEISFVVVSGSASECINNIVQATECEYVVVDDISLDYSIPSLLAPFRSASSPSCCSASMVSNKLFSMSSDRVSLPDVITTRTFPANLSFSKNTWAQLGGIDTSLNDTVVLWDFYIRALSIPGSYSMEASGVLLESDVDSYASVTADSHSDYNSILFKHRELYNKFLSEVLYLSSKNQILVRDEIRIQAQKIAKLIAELDKTRHDNISIAEHVGRLRNHIDFIENDRLYRVSKKLKHYKNIFFKSSGTKSGNFKKLFKFILFAFSKAGLLIVRKVFKRVFRQIYLWVEDRPVKLVFLDKSDGDRSVSYQEWIAAKLNIKLLKAEYEEGKSLLVKKPKISIIVPVYNPPLSFLHDAIKSVLNQLYDNWELCISDDCSPDPQIRRLLNAYSMKDERIKVHFREKNGHISANSNSALSLATGDYVLLLDHDDLLSPNCLFEVVKHINEHPEDKLIYSDEDKVDGMNVHSSPFFKPDWSPDKFFSMNYISHVVVIEKKLVDEVGGFRLGFEGSQDYDLLLRVAERTAHIGHIPKVLYHWRIHSASVASEEGDAKPYAYIAAKKALEEALVRRNTPGEVQFQSIRGSYRIKYQVKAFEKVSIIIPTKDGVKMLKNTIDSIFKLTSYPNFEVVVMNNNSVTEEFFTLMDEYKESYPDVFKCVEASFPFNFSRLINLGVANSDGEYILMLNNDVEILHADWITTMVSYAQHERNGAIGVKLLYPDDTIQHAGTVVGLGDIRCAGHVFVGFYKDSPGYYNYLQSSDNTSAVTAACLMVRRSVYEEVGGMEEQLEVEYNDVDFCLRVLDKGYYNIYVPEVVLYHYESATRGHPQQTKESYERHVREVAFFQKTWEKYINRDPFYNPNLSLDEGDYRMNLSLTEKELSYK